MWQLQKKLSNSDVKKKEAWEESMKVTENDFY